MSRIDRIAGAPHPLSRRGFVIASLGAGGAFGFAPLAQAAMDPAVPGGVPPRRSPRSSSPPCGSASTPRGWSRSTSSAPRWASMWAPPWRASWPTNWRRTGPRCGSRHVDSDPKWGLMVTGGSWSVWQTFPIFSKAGAAGRIALIEAGAKLMGVAAGGVHGGATGRYRGQAVPHLRPDRRQGRRGANIHRRGAGQAAPQAGGGAQADRQADAGAGCADKTNGTAVFGIDAKAPGMVYARPKLPPTRNGSKVVSVDDTAAKTVKGYIRYLTLDDPSETVPGWVLAIAQTYPAAIKAADALKVTWTPGPTAGVSEQDIQDHGVKLIADPTAGAVLDTGHQHRPGLRGGQLETGAEPTPPARPALPDGAGERPGLRKGRHVRDPRRQPVAEPDLPLLAKALGRRSRQHRDAHLSAGRRLRPAAARRLCRARGPCRQGAGQAGQAGADPPRRHAVRLCALALGADPAHGFRPGRPR